MVCVPRAQATRPRQRGADDSGFGHIVALPSAGGGPARCAHPAIGLAKLAADQAECVLTIIGKKPSQSPYKGGTDRVARRRAHGATRQSLSGVCDALEDRTFRRPHAGESLLRPHARVSSPPFPIRRLKRHIKRGKLPSYSFIEPNHRFGGDRQGSSQHPGGNKKKPHDFLNGEQLVADIYNWLRSEPQIWEKTLFLITYDEHGGFYDHVPARQVVPPGDRIYSQPGYQFQFDLSGPRVPAVLVSPWIRQGTLDQTPYDHASIVKTVRELFIPGTAALSDREEASPSVLHNLTLNQLRSDAPQLTPLTLAALGAVATALNAHAQPSADDTPDASEMHAALLELGEQVRKHLPPAQQPLAGAPLASPTEHAPIAAQAAFSNELAERVHELSRDDDDGDDDD